MLQLRNYGSLHGEVITEGRNNSSQSTWQTWRETEGDGDQDSASRPPFLLLTSGSQAVVGVKTTHPHCRVLRCSSARGGAVGKSWGKLGFLSEALSGLLAHLPGLPQVPELRPHPWPWVFSIDKVSSWVLRSSAILVSLLEKLVGTWVEFCLHNWLESAEAALGI